MMKPLSVKLVKVLLIIKIVLVLIVAASALAFLLAPGNSNGVYSNFREVVLNTLGYRGSEFNVDSFARLCGMLTWPLLLSCTNLIAINRRKRKLLIGAAIINLLFSINSILNLTISAMILGVIVLNKELKKYMLSSEKIVS